MLWYLFIVLYVRFSVKSWDRDDWIGMIGPFSMPFVALAAILGPIAVVLFYHFGGCGGYVPDADGVAMAPFYDPAWPFVAFHKVLVAAVSEFSLAGS